MRFLLTIFTVLCIGTQTQAADLGDDGLYKTDWMRETFNDLSEDLAEANAEGKTLLILVEQRGCIYCKRMHEDVFVQPEINQFITDNYFVVQLNLFGDVEVTDFDGTTLPEKDMMRRWGQSFTPTMMFFSGEVEDGQTATEAAITIVAGALEAPQTLSLLMWANDPQARQTSGLSEFHDQRVGN